MKKLSIIALGTALAASPAAAAPIALMNAKVIDGTGALPVAETVLIDGKTILAVGKGIKIPSGAQRIDYRGRTIIPGLISDHSHVGQYQGVTEGPAAYTRDNIVAALQQYRRYGVLTVVALGDNRPLFDELRADAHAGRIPGADLFGVDQGIGVPDGALPQAIFHSAPDQLFRPRTPEEARQAVRTMVAEHTDLVKIWVDNFGGSMPAKMSPEIYKAVIDESHRLGARVAAHIHDLDDAQGVVDAGVDILAHGVRDKPVPASFVAEMKQRGIWYIPTLALDEATVAWAQQAPWTKSPEVRAGLSPELMKQIDDPAWREKTLASPQAPGAISSLKMNLANLRTLYNAGVKIGFGTDSGALPPRVPGVEEHRELALLVQAGLTPMQALIIATRDAAQLMELSDRGTIAPGKRADLVILSKDPEDDIAAVDSIVETWRAGGREAVRQP